MPWTRLTRSSASALEVPWDRPLARKLSPSLMTPAEWRRKRARDDSFAARIATQPKLFVIGSDDELG